ncbi:hypothetical protein BN1723_019755, partial [Verticillium longisporum]
IQPTAFKKRMTAFHYEPTERIDKLEKMTALTEQVSTATVNYLYEGKHLQKEKKHGATSAPLSAASTNPLKSKPLLAAKGNGADFYQTPNLSPRTPSPAKQTKPRRRLVQGRRPNRSPS